MDQKQQNMALTEALLSNAYWEKEYAHCFSEDLTLVFHAAPPGMPQHMDAFDAELFFQWLRRTTRSWTMHLEELKGTPDENLFWAVGSQAGIVNWGAGDTDFSSKFICKIDFTGGKVSCLSIIMDPLAFLAAAGRDIPIFRMDLYDPRIDAFLAAPTEEGSGAAPAPADTNPEAVRARRQRNLDAFRSGDYFKALAEMASYAPDYESKVWFLPPEMKAEYSPELMPRVHAWTSLSCPWIDFDRRGRAYATDDPNVWFCEYMCYGETDWIGNNCRGMYRNRYFYRIEMDDAGYMKKCEEFLNPINKYNSINVSLPSFPYWL